MNDARVTGKGCFEHIRPAVRLRTPERRQMGWVTECLDDLVSGEHAVRMVMAVVEKLDMSGFCEPIKAREGSAGRDATDPRLLVALWLYACIRGIGSARELARRCEESAPFRWLCGGGDGESSPAVGFSHRSGGGAGRVIYAGDRVAGGPATGFGEPHQPGRGAGAGERGGGQLPPGAAASGVAGEGPAARAGVASAGGGAVAGVEAEAGGSGEASGAGSIRAESAGARAAGEYHRPGRATQEDAQRGL